MKKNKDKKVLASIDELQEEGLAGSEDTWSGYHGRQKQVRPKKKLYFKIHEESFWLEGDYESKV